ncbi:hypothetical protein AAC387_Pa05g2785 [Persea americana]
MKGGYLQSLTEFRTGAEQKEVAQRTLSVYKSTQADLSAVIPSDFAHKTFIAIYMLRFQGASYLLLIEQIKKLQ